MKKRVTWLISLLMGLVFIQSVHVNAKEHMANNDILIKLNHENQSNTPTEFFIYDISEEQYHEALEMTLESSVDKTKKWLKESNLSPLKEILVSPGIVSEQSLPKYNEQMDRMYYVLLQKKPDKEGEEGKEVYQVFPIFISFDELQGNEMTIETKRVFLIQAPYFFKYSAGNIEKPLEGAEFTFYRLNQDNQKEYLMNLDPIKWGKSTSSVDTWHFNSGPNGLVSIPDLGLELGTYYFEETKAPDGYIISVESKKIPLIINEDEEGLVMSIGGERLVPMPAGELPKEIVEKGKPRVLNDLLEDFSNKSIRNSNEFRKEGFLPKTGEAQWAFSSFGLILIVITFIYYTRRKENE